MACHSVVEYRVWESQSISFKKKLLTIVQTERPYDAKRASAVWACRIAKKVLDVNSLTKVFPLHNFEVIKIQYQFSSEGLPHNFLHGMCPCNSHIEGFPWSSCEPISQILSGQGPADSHGGVSHYVALTSPVPFWPQYWRSNRWRIHFSNVRSALRQYISPPPNLFSRRCTGNEHGELFDWNIAMLIGPAYQSSLPIALCTSYSRRT